MTKNQFFYTDTTTVTGESLIASFNINNVVRTLQNDKGGALVILDDIREAYVQVPIQKGKTTSWEYRKQDVASEITLNRADYERFSQEIGLNIPTFYEEEKEESFSQESIEA